MVEVTIYSTRYCGYCRHAEALLRRHGIPFTAVDLTNDPEARERVIERSGMRTVPVIFLGDQLIGGYAELAALARLGDLRQRLAAASGRQPSGTTPAP